MQPPRGDKRPCLSACRGPTSKAACRHGTRGQVPFSGSAPCVNLTAHAQGHLAPRRRPQTEVDVASIEYSQVRKGMVIVRDGGQLFHVVDRDLNTPGNWRAQLKLKLKNLKTGVITEVKVRPQDKCEQAYLDKREMQYLYRDGEGYVFMDTENYDQITLGRDWVGDLMYYLKEGDKAHVV